MDRLLSQTILLFNRQTLFLQAHLNSISSAIRIGLSLSHSHTQKHNIDIKCRNTAIHSLRTYLPLFTFEVSRVRNNMSIASIVCYQIFLRTLLSNFCFVEIVHQCTGYGMCSWDPISDQNTQHYFVRFSDVGYRPFSSECIGLIHKNLHAYMDRFFGKS
jgi:hypothetical protein